MANIGLFDYIKIVFSKNEKGWKELTDADKRSNFWMLNRYISIQYPLKVNYLSLLKINPITVSDYWHKVFSNQYTAPPGWVYTKTLKKVEQEKKLDLPSEAMIVYYCNREEISRKDFDQSVKFFGKEFVDELKAQVKILK